MDPNQSSKDDQPSHENDSVADGEVMNSNELSKDDQPSHENDSVADGEVMNSNELSKDDRPTFENDPVAAEEEDATQQIRELDSEETPVRPITWNDAIFIEKFLPMALVKDKVTTADAIPAAKALLNWYVHGIKPKYSSDAILFVFYAMTINDRRIEVHTSNKKIKVFPSILMKGETFLKKPDETDRIEEITYTSPISTRFKPGNLSQPESSRKRKPTVPKIKKFTEQEVKNWYTRLWEALDQNPENTDEKNRPKPETAINLIGFLYMSLQRLTVKNKFKVCNYLTLSAFQSFRNIWGNDSDIEKIVGIIPPTSNMVVDFIKDYKQYSANSMRCLAAMVYAYGRTDKHQFLNSTQRVMSASCLHMLKFVNLGFTEWIDKIITRKNYTYYELIQYMNDEKHLETSIAIADLAKCAQNLEEYSWYWAKMFSKKAFPNLLIKDDPEYAMTIFSISIGCDLKNPLWDKLFSRFDSTGEIKIIAFVKASLIHQDKTSKESDIFVFYQESLRILKQLLNDDRYNRNDF